MRKIEGLLKKYRRQDLGCLRSTRNGALGEHDLNTLSVCDIERYIVVHSPIVALLPSHS